MRADRIRRRAPDWFNGPSGSTPKLVVGISVLVGGLLLTLDNLNLVETSQLLEWWPLAIIAVGATVFAEARARHSRIAGVIVMLVGGWVLLDRFDIIDVNPFALFWPVVLIVAGTSLVLQSMRRRDALTDDSDAVSAFAFLGSVKRKSDATRFRYAELSSMWGGCELDLRRATIPPGEEATVEVFTLMGGHEIRVPSTWHVDSQVFPFMAGVEDKTEAPREDSPPRLVVRGALIMGGLTIDN